MIYNKEDMCPARVIMLHIKDQYVSSDLYHIDLGNEYDMMREKRYAGYDFYFLNESEYAAFLLEST